MIVRRGEFGCARARHLFYKSIDLVALIGNFFSQAILDVVSPAPTVRTWGWSITGTIARSIDVDTRWQKCLLL